eukprot:5402569-Amphidinium_carterae.1
MSERNVLSEFQKQQYEQLANILIPIWFLFKSYHQEQRQEANKEQTCLAEARGDNKRRYCTRGPSPNVVITTPLIVQSIAVALMIRTHRFPTDGFS